MYLQIFPKHSLKNPLYRLYRFCTKHVKKSKYHENVLDVVPDSTVPQRSFQENQWLKLTKTSGSNTKFWMAFTKLALIKFDHTFFLICSFFAVVLFFRKFSLTTSCWNTLLQKKIIKNMCLFEKIFFQVRKVWAQKTFKDPHFKISELEWFVEFFFAWPSFCKW